MAKYENRRRSSLTMGEFLLFAAGTLFCLVLITTAMMGGLLARYTTKAEASDSARVAKFSVSGELSNNVTVVCGTADNGVYTITVTNASEVAVSYDMTIRFNDALDDSKLAVTLKEEDATRTGTLSTDKKSISYSTLGNLAPNSNQEYTLDFEVKDWSYVTQNADGKSATSDLDFMVEITATQID